MRTSHCRHAHEETAISFFYAPIKAEAKQKPRTIKRDTIPIQSLRELGCSVCKLDKAKLRSPKMAPSGTDNPEVYLLGMSPSEEDDDADMQFADKAGEAIVSKFGKAYMEDSVRCNYIVQCHGESDTVEIECCRNRVIADIERTKPPVIVTVGDAAFYWATGLSKGGVIPHRGSVFVAQIGRHACRVVPVLYPNFVHKRRQYGKSEYELALEFDIRKAKQLASDNRWTPPRVYKAPYDNGIDIITGSEPGDLLRLERALQRVAEMPKCALDIETNGLRPYFLREPHIWTIAIGSYDYTVAFPVDHPEGWGTDARKERVWSLLGAFLLSSGRKAAHNIAMEMEWLYYFFGRKVLRSTEWDDTMAMAHTLDERPGTKALEVQTVLHFGFNLKAQSNIDVRDFATVEGLCRYPIKQVLRYNGMDAKWTDKLRDTLQPLVDAENPAEYARKMRLAPTLILTEAKGLPVDMEYAKRLSADYKAKLATIEKKLSDTSEVRTYERKFGRFIPTNPDHVLKLMRDVCERPEVKTEDSDGTVRYTTDEKALSQIPASEAPSAALILDHRQLAKLNSTYLEPIITRAIVCPDNRLRSKYSSMVAVTGRLASEDPSIQNWPSRKNKEVRAIVVALGHQWLLSMDYGQIEFRVIGMASEDRNIVKYCWTGYDVHGYWADRLIKIYPKVKDWIVDAFEVDWDEKGRKTLRQEMKNKWVFPLFYGGATTSSAAYLNIPVDVADDLADEFWDEFRGVKTWQQRLLEKYEKTLYVESLGGRRRRGPMTKNEIINCPVQGTANDIVTEAMNVLSEEAELEDDEELQPSLNVHDDLTTIVADAHLEAKMDHMAHVMCKPRFDYINVPLVVEAKVGPNWHDMKEIRVYSSTELFSIPNPYER